MTRTPAAFYFDLASPLAYLAAERVLHVFSNPPTSAEWRPVLARELGGAGAGLTPGRSDAPGGPLVEGGRDVPRAEIERRARELGLQPLRWPAPFPFDSALAMRAATYAASIGRTVPFAQAAFRQAFAGGHSLESEDYVLIAAAACEMHPTAVLRGAAMRATAQRLAATTATAAQSGVTEVPAIVVGERVFAGAQALERAARQLREAVADEPAGRATDATGASGATFELTVHEPEPRSA